MSKQVVSNRAPSCGLRTTTSCALIVASRAPQTSTSEFRFLVRRKFIHFSDDSCHFKLSAITSLPQYTETICDHHFLVSSSSSRQFIRFVQVGWYAVSATVMCVDREVEISIFKLVFSASFPSTCL